MCRWLIKKVSKKYKDIYNVIASHSESEEYCCIVHHICCGMFIILLLLINYDRIIAEITTPIRCAIAGDTVRVLMPVEEWQKQRGIEKLRSVENYNEYRTLLELSYSNLSPSEKKLIPYKINFDGNKYVFDEGVVHSGIIIYLKEINYLNIFITYKRIVYDVFLQKIILSSDDVRGQYWTLMGPGSIEIKCREPSNYDKLIEHLYQYNF
ncbi:hypothetical protein ACFFHT_01455 [Gallibacterium melopsittaci]|uniref:WYL domain-containing protein n=1 Tax=Gallibacterium melopsittaci TaxID=516063 RepID=A0ABV6HTP7_9PAST